jgi:acyl-CoA reductase-like NAD-dependent aldehyde dehydrogenase
MTVTLPDSLSEPARRFAGRRHDLLIGAERVAALDGGTFATVDPATGEQITEVAYAGPQDVDRAVLAARSAFDEGPWTRMPAAERSHLMNLLADAIEANAEELAELEALDNGKPVTYARIVDVGGTVAYLRYFAGWPTKIEGATIPVRQPDMLCYTRKEPVGVCGQIIPWNFP